MPPRVPPPQITPESLDDYLEVMTKVVFQSGMSWKVIDAKWPGICEAFRNFNIQHVAGLTEEEIEILLGDTRIIRNARKLYAIKYNAQTLLDLEDKHGSFASYLRNHGDFDATLKALRRDFKFLGPSGIFYFLYVVGEEVPPHAEFEAQYRK